MMKYRAWGCDIMYPVVDATGYKAPFSEREIPISEYFSTLSATKTSRWSGREEYPIAGRIPFAENPHKDSFTV